MNDEQLSPDEAFELLQKIRNEHDFDTSTDDQDEP